MKIRKGFVIILILVLLIFAVILELGHNTLFGWGALLILSVGFFVLHAKGLSKRKWYFRLFAWFCFIVVLAGVVRLSEPRARQIPAVDVKNPVVTDTVTVKQGQLTGVFNEDKSVEVYAGIPYAKPPVGELRWKEPQEPDSWDGVLACDTFAPMSMQQQNVFMDSLNSIFGFHNFKISLKDNFKEAMSEDSLYLNVWKPAGDVSDLPVLVFIHGGSLTGGHTSYSEYNGETLASKGIIVVNFAYRLNVFGYYANDELAQESPNGTTGNYGLLDQIQALKWVKENIASFGGNPDEITVAGESAGASSVNAICVSPLAKGLFRRAVAESSGITAKVPYHTFRTIDDALEMGRNIMAEFGAESIGALRSVPAEKIVNTRFTNSEMTVDGYAITEQPYLTYEKGENNEEALLSGFNAHEADLFSMFNKVTTENYEDSLKHILGDNAKKATELFPAEPQDEKYIIVIDQKGDAKGAYDKVLSAAWFTYSHYNWSRLLAAQGRDVYEYYFSMDNKSLGSFHAGEMPYLYGNLDRHAWLYTDGDRALSETMQSYLLNFVKTGNPNGDGLPVWEKFNENDRKVLEFNSTVKMTDDPYYELYALFDDYQDSLVK
jgi:para-nitrobenzyl esterase